MRTTRIRNIGFYQLLLLIHLIGVIFLIISDYIHPTITRALYCLVVFSSPWLAVEFGHRYLYAEKLSLQAIVPFVIEVLVCVLFIGSMICGIKDGGQALQALFSWLLVVYIIDVAICVLHIICSGKISEASFSACPTIR